MIIAVLLAGFRLRPKVVGATLVAPPPAVATANLASLRPADSTSRRKLPWRGRIWGAFIPPWPNYGSRHGKPNPPDSRK